VTAGISVNWVKDNWQTALAIASSVVAILSLVVAAVAAHHSRNSAQAADRSARAAEAMNETDQDRRLDELKAPVAKLVVEAQDVQEVGDEQRDPDSTKDYRQPVTWTLHLHNRSDIPLTVRTVTTYFGPPSPQDNGLPVATTQGLPVTLQAGEPWSNSGLPAMRRGFRDRTVDELVAMPLDHEVTVEDPLGRTWVRHRGGRIDEVTTA